MASPALGFYRWSWGDSSDGPAGATFSVAFSGIADVKAALAASGIARAEAGGALPFLALGGSGDVVFTPQLVQHIEEQLPLLAAAGYHGVLYDVEAVNGSTSLLLPAFASLFNASSALGLRVGVTTSNSAPYAASDPADAAVLMRAWLASPHLDFFSPQARIHTRMRHRDR